MNFLASLPFNGLKPIIIDEKDRYQNLFMIGDRGSGKTSFFLNLINEEKDNAFIVLDPNGDLAERVASLVPEERLIYVSKDNPLSLNPLTRKHLSKTENIHELVQVVNASVQAFSNQVDITVKMERISWNAISVIPKDILTIEYLSNFLDSPTARKKHFEKYPINTYWKEFENKGYKYEQTRMSAERITDRFSLLYQDENLNPFITGDNEFDIPKLAEERKAVVFNLHGFDDEITAFIGCLISFQLKSYYLHQATKESPPLYFYCDEYHLFISEIFGRFITEARKYNISCNFSGHSLQQVSKKLSEMMLSCYMLVAFNCGYDDCDRIAKELSIKADDIKQLTRYRAIIGLGRKPHLALVLPPPDVKPYSIPGINFLRNSYIVVK